jgi:hypothetical protein
MHAHHFYYFYQAFVQAAKLSWRHLSSSKVVQDFTIFPKRLPSAVAAPTRLTVFTAVVTNQVPWQLHINIP